jgi:predicted nucleic acid-binding protein
VIYLLDSNAVSDAMCEDMRTIARMAALGGGDQLVTCAIVRGEILFGIERLPEGKRRQALAAKAELLFSTIHCEPVPVSAAVRYAAIKKAWQQQGLALGDNDLWIAATTLILGAKLVSRDRDYRDIDGLIVEDWSK